MIFSFHVFLLCFIFIYFEILIFRFEIMITHPDFSQFNWVKKKTNRKKINNRKSVQRVVLRLGEPARTPARYGGWPSQSDCQTAPISLSRPPTAKQSVGGIQINHGKTAKMKTRNCTLGLILYNLWVLFNMDHRQAWPMKLRTVASHGKRKKVCQSLKLRKMNQIREIKTTNSFCEKRSYKIEINGPLWKALQI